MSQIESINWNEDAFDHLVLQSLHGQHLPGLAHLYSRNLYAGLSRGSAYLMTQLHSGQIGCSPTARTLLTARTISAYAVRKKPSVLSLYTTQVWYSRGGENKKRSRRCLQKCYPVCSEAQLKVRKVNQTVNAVFNSS